MPYVITSFICMAPGSIAFSWLGHAGQGALSGDATAIRFGFYALGLLAVIAFVPRLVKRMRMAETNWMVCKTDMRLARAAEILRDVGSGDVRVLRGGMMRWREQHPN